MEDQIHVKVVVQGKKKGVPGWPHIEYDYEKQTAEVLRVLQGRLPNFHFNIKIYDSSAEAQNDFQDNQEKYDGMLVLTTANWWEADFLLRQEIPTVIADIPHTGSGGFLRLNSRIISENLPIPTVSSLNFNDIADAIRMFEVIKKIRKSRILVFTDNPDYDREVLLKARELWGCDFVIKTSADILEAYNTVSDNECAPLAQRWMDECIEMLEPTKDEVLRSAKFYYALQKLKKENSANAVTVDCLKIFYKGHMPAYPCMSFFEMGRNGEIGVCEADIDSTVTSLLLLYVTGRVGFVSDPVIDTSSSQIIYDHCVSCNKTFGKDDARACPYYLRSHAEDRKGVAVQAIFPSGEPLTTVKVSCQNKVAGIHSGVSVGNVALESGCRTKLAAHANVADILRNWNFELLWWHRVTVFGDYRREMENLFKLKGLKVIHEDRDKD